MARRKLDETIDEGALREAEEEAAAPSANDLAVEAYGLFCKGQSEGEYPAWGDLPTPTQKLWRESYNHVATGGKPRTDYEHAVKYLIVSAQ